MLGGGGAHIRFRSTKHKTMSSIHLYHRQSPIALFFYWLKKCGVFHIAIVQVLLRCRAVPTTVLVRMDMIWIGVESMHDEQCHLARE